MNELAPNIADLKTKVEKLVSLHKQFKNENERLVNDISTLQKTVEDQKVKLNILEKENKTLLENKNEEQNKIITETKTKINELVQEIDNCIALLNK